MRMKVTGLGTVGCSHHITMEPADEHRDADGITMVEILCGDTEAVRYAMGSFHEVYVGDSALRSGNGRD